MRRGSRKEDSELKEIDDPRGRLKKGKALFGTRIQRA